MNNMTLLKKYHISVTNSALAVEDAGLIGINQQRKLIKELFKDFTIEYPNKKYYITLTLKFLVRDIVEQQITIPYTTLKPYKKAVNNAKRMAKTSVYAKYVLENQPTIRKKRTKKLSDDIVQ